MNLIKYYISKLIRKIQIPSIVDSVIHIKSKVEAGSLIVNSNFERHTFCGYDCTIVNTDVGPFTSIGSRVIIGGASHPMHYVSMSPVFLSHKDSVSTKLSKHDFLPCFITHVGADVWIGDAALVKSGVNVGTGSVIGMGSVVTADVPPYAIVAGNPARLVRYRFDKITRELLIESKWWQHDDETLKLLAPYITNPVLFIEKIKNLIAL